jgi:hypothetical protein
LWGDKVVLFYEMSMLWETAMNEEDEAFEQIDKAQGWRKRQAEELREEFNKFKDAFSDKQRELPPSRNMVLEEVAREFDKMKMFGDTAASFAAFVRNMKK